MWLPSLSMHRFTADDFRQVFSNLVESWDHQFPRSDAPLAADRDAGNWRIAMPGIGGSQQAIAMHPKSGAPNPWRTEGHGDNHLASPRQTC
jgi:hypothetical protein